MLTASKERFDAIQREAPSEYKSNLIQVTKYQAGKNCKVLHRINETPPADQFSLAQVPT